MVNNEAKEINERVGKKIRGKLAERKIKRYQVAQWLKISDMTVSMKLNGRTAFTVAEFSIISTMLCLPPSEILDIIEWKG